MLSLGQQVDWYFFDWLTFPGEMLMPSAVAQSGVLINKTSFVHLFLLLVVGSKRISEMSWFLALGIFSPDCAMRLSCKQKDVT